MCNTINDIHREIRMTKLHYKMSFRDTNDCNDFLFFHFNIDSTIKWVNRRIYKIIKNYFHQAEHDGLYFIYSIFYFCDIIFQSRHI